MTVKAQDITVYEGEDKTIKISVTDTEGGSPVDLTGATSITWLVTASYLSVLKLIEKQLSNGIILENDAGSNDRIVIPLDSADTVGMGGKTYYHECRIVDVSAKSHVVAVGDISVISSSVV